MQIALISDIHGNYPALCAVLEDAAKRNISHYVFAGDYIFDNPFPNEVTNRLRLMDNATVIKGNKENYLCTMQKEDPALWKYDQLAALYWTYRELSLENRKFLTALPEETYIDLPYGKKLYAVHFMEKLEGRMTKTDCSSSRYAERMKVCPFTHAAYLERLQREVEQRTDLHWLAGLEASVVVTGHSHLQWYFRRGGVLWVNPGSCGQPLDFDPRAPYTILHINADKISVEERRVPYDWEALSRSYGESGIREAAPVWTALVEKATRGAQDVFSPMFAAAAETAAAKGESGAPFSNETWHETAVRTGVLQRE